MTYNEAVAKCKRIGMKIATFNQLHEAWEDGYQRCRSGWLLDRFVGYPMQVANSNCGNKNGIIEYGFKSPSNKYDVFCYTG